MINDELSRCFRGCSLFIYNGKKLIYTYTASSVIIRLRRLRIHIQVYYKFCLDIKMCVTLQIKSRVHTFTFIL